MFHIECTAKVKMFAIVKQNTLAYSNKLCSFIPQKGFITPDTEYVLTLNERKRDGESLHLFLKTLYLVRFETHQCV
jgi:hypothetical protein